MSKIMTAVAFGAGYVLGAKAGRERYEQLSAKAQELWSHPKVQETTTKAKDQAGKVQEQAQDRLKSSKHGNGDSSADPMAADVDSVLAGGVDEDVRG